MSPKAVLSRYPSFNFDEMAELAKNSPSDFCRRRAELIEDAIINSRDGDKVRQLQKAIESDRICEWSHDVAVAYFVKQLRFVIGSP